MKCIRITLLLAAVLGAPAPAQDLSPQPMPAMSAIPTIGPPSQLFFVQGEPADSLYRAARDVLAKGDYGRAAQMFRDIAAKYPKTVYENDLPYYEAFARYRIGTTEELERAVKLLEPRAAKLIGVSSPASSGSGYSSSTSGRNRTSDSDVAALYVRINSALVSRGNSAAAGVVAQAAQLGPSCDREEMQVKVEVISALSQMDPVTMLRLIRGVLDKNDECTVDLRRRVVFVLGRRGDAEAATLLACVAQSDPSTDVRVEAISWLAKVQGDAGVVMLEELLRTDKDERIQRAVVRTLTSSDNAKARNSMRALIDRKDVPTNLRVDAIGAFTGERATSDDAAYLRSLYGRADNDRVKEAVIYALARIGGPENDQWILNLAKNPNEPSAFRTAAISRLLRSTTPVADLSKLYDASDTYDVRSRIVAALENRREQEAADKLVEIFRTSTVYQIKIQAMNALNRRKDPRSAQLLQEALEGRRP